jgi:uroporphyrinogen III methyltransferase/synthase
MLAERHDVADIRAIWPCAEGARHTLQDGIEHMGGSVNRVHTYRSVADDEHMQLIRAEVERGRLNLAAFTSASAVKAFVEALEPRQLSGVRAASIGPVTSESLREAGIQVVVESEEATLESLVRAIVLSTAGDDLE